MKIISILRGLSISLAPDRTDFEEKSRWFRDPLAHPALEAMSERELADLPFSRGLRSGIPDRACCAQ